MKNYSNLAKMLQRAGMENYIAILNDITPKVGVTKMVRELLKRDGITTSLDKNIIAKNIRNRSAQLYATIPLTKFMVSWILSNNNICGQNLTKPKINKLVYFSVLKQIQNGVEEVFQRITFEVFIDGKLDKFKVIENVDGENFYCYCYSDLDLQILLPEELTGFKIVKIPKDIKEES